MDDFYFLKLARHVAFGNLGCRQRNKINCEGFGRYIWASVFGIVSTLHDDPLLMGCTSWENGNILISQKWEKISIGRYEVPKETNFYESSLELTCLCNTPLVACACVHLTSRR
jgi:hypothetical protein